MSTVMNPPSYGENQSFTRIPSYSAEPNQFEHRIALNEGLRTLPTGSWVKQSKGGGVSLRLTQQENSIELPVYGCGGSVNGTIELSKLDGVSSVEVKIEGRLRLKEIAEGGTATSTLVLDSLLLWSKTDERGPCPSSLPFSLKLPTTFEAEGKTYPLPPTYEVHLSGLPGFRAWIDYSVAAHVTKPKANIFGRAIGATVVNTPFIYSPRTRPALPLPVLMQPSSQPETYGFTESPEWFAWDAKIPSNSPAALDILTKLYLPAGRVFCFKETIPFHLLFHSSALSLAAFLPYGPSAGLISPTKRYTRLQLVRQSTVDVRNAIILGTKTDIWRVETIGEATFNIAGNGPDWIAFSGEIAINDDVKVGGFKAAGLSVKDCILLSMMPPEPTKAPFGDLRKVVPVRLTTDPWAADGTGIAAEHYAKNPSGDDDEDEAHPPELHY